MQRSVQSEYQHYLKKLRRSTFLRNFVRVMSCIVVFCTTYALILPAITMEGKTFCGFEEHVHSEKCYKRNKYDILICTPESAGIHIHGEDCYDSLGELVCEKPDYFVHSHSEDCYDTNGYLICSFEEHPAHIHGEECYGIPDSDSVALHVHSEVCYAQEQGELTCTLEESEGHSHSQDCYIKGDELQCTVAESHVHGEGCYEYPLVCTESTEPHLHHDTCFSLGACICTLEENHVHTDACLQQYLVCESTDEEHEHSEECYDSDLICMLEENHTHSDQCYDRIQNCTMDEGQAHVHETTCYSTEPVLICSIVENHIHDDSCYNQVLACELPESSGHKHDDGCYGWTEVLSCTLEEGQPESVDPVLICTVGEEPTHVHDESCFDRTKPEFVLLCTDLSEDHVHSAQCYELDCGKKEHTHSIVCYSDPDADVETAQDWEKDFKDLELTGDWNADILTIAQTQLGYKESTRNYEVWPDESLHGYTRYGDWYGIPHGDWCAMFVSFCLEYAQVDSMPHSARVIPWIEELTELKLYHEADVYTPNPGDLIFYDWNLDESCDHVGLVAEVIEATEYEPAQVKALEGNSSDRVQYVYYDLNDEVIMGYSKLPENAELYICGIAGHQHNEYCVDENEQFICEEIEHIHLNSCLAEPKDAAADEIIVPTYFCGMDVHSHVEDCYNEDGNLNCGATEHNHNDECLAEPETEPVEESTVFYCGFDAHTHGADCYNEDDTLNCGASEHIHNDECLAEPETEPVEEPKSYYCGFDVHAHNDDCLDLDGNLICEITEHTHDESCEIEPVAVYYCGREEHSHDEACYDTEGTLICLSEEHSHNDECKTEPVTEPAEEPTVFYCGFEVHTHGDDCYNEDETLNCTITEHVHTEECLAEPITEPEEEPKTYYCGFDSHAHDEDCLDQDGNLICVLTEHTHDASCEIEPVVVYYCGREAHVHDNVCYGTEGTMICPLKAHVHDAGCEVEVSYQCQISQHSHDDNCYGEEGTLTCNLTEHLHTFACEGFTCGIEKHYHSSQCYNESYTLICKALEHEHSYLCKHYTCGKAVHIHGHWCYDVNSNLACGFEEHRHSSECLTFQLVYADENMTVAATITSVEYLPADIELMVIPVTQSSAPEQFNSMTVAISEELSSSNQCVTEATFFDLKLKSGGSFYELPETAMIAVTMEFSNPVFATEENTKAFVITPNPNVSEDPVPEATEPAADSFLDSLEEAVSQFFIDASASEIDEDEIVGSNPSGSYQASDITGKDDGGVTSVSSKTNQLPSFAFALTRDASFSQYWERVDSLNELKTGLNYIIVSAEGGYAMLGNDSANAVPVTMVPIAGHEDVYRITVNNANAATKNLLWTFEPDGSNFKIVNAGTSQQISLNNGTLFGTQSCTVRYMAVENCFRIHELTTNSNTSANYHLFYHEHDDYSDNFISTTSANKNSDSATSDFGVTFYNARDMVIYRMLPVGSSYSVPDKYDAMANPPAPEVDDDEVVSKPAYDPFVEITDEGDVGDTGVGSVKGQYYHDAATSDLEKYFHESATKTCDIVAHTHDDGCYERQWWGGRELVCGYDYQHTHGPACQGISEEGSEVFAKHQLNDGMVRTDKSVIYGDDDYGAFADYDPNIFGVTLSALGQAYPISNQYKLTTPVDVVFVLDCSGSMSDYKVNNKSRAEIMVEALNDTIETLMLRHEENRVGVVLYAQGTDEVLPLGRYTADNKQYFITNRDSFLDEDGDELGYNVYIDLTKQSKTVDRVYAGSSLKTEARYERITDGTRPEGSYVKVSGNDTARVTYRKATADELNSLGIPLYKLAAAANGQYAGLGKDTFQGYGTYTQAGIAMGSKVFHDVPKADTTYSVTIKNAENEDETISTQRQPVFILLSDGEPTYSTPMYTDALSGVDYADGNGGGGNVVGIHGFYTILSANHYKRMVGIHYDRPALFYSIGLGVDQTSSGTTPNYKKAVLDPRLVNNLSNDANSYSATSGQLKNLLSGSFNDQSAKTFVNWPDDWTNVPHLYEPAMPNPFATNYAYADGSSFGNFSSEQLANEFDQFIQSGQRESEYGFVLVENTGVAMADYIGAGMEIKGIPVLRYRGVNYNASNVTTTTEVLKDTSGKIVYDEDGNPINVTVRTLTYNKVLPALCPGRDIVDLSTIVVRITDDMPVEHIYRCGNNNANHVHSEEECGIYHTYLCGHHTHWRSCYDDNGNLTCYDPHDHEATGCKPILTTQKVEMAVPDDTLPVYMPDLASNNFYYEDLPVRLIYQVGLTSEAESAVAALALNGGELTFYTNRWGGNQHARSDLHPSLDNPFYYDQVVVDPETGIPMIDPDTGNILKKPHTYQPHINYKGGTEVEAEYDPANNVTGTEKYAVNCHEGDSQIQIQEALHVYHELGNNGKLVFNVDSVDIPVEKIWSQGTPDSDKPDSVEMKLYRITPGAEGEKPAGTLISTISVTPDADGAWDHVFANVPKPVDGWYYAIVETSVDGFEASYNGGGSVEFTVTVGDTSTEMIGEKVPVSEEGTTPVIGKVTVTNTYQWNYELPKTGGTGTTLIYALGTFITVIACALIVTQKKTKVKRGI